MRPTNWVRANRSNILTETEVGPEILTLLPQL
jgi:hypothetical protein